MIRKKYTSPKVREIDVCCESLLTDTSGGGNSLQGIQHENFQKSDETVTWEDGTDSWSWQ